MYPIKCQPWKDSYNSPFYFNTQTANSTGEKPHKYLLLQLRSPTTDPSAQHYWLMLSLSSTSLLFPLNIPNRCQFSEAPCSILISTSSFLRDMRPVGLIPLIITLHFCYKFFYMHIRSTCSSSPGILDPCPAVCSPPATLLQLFHNTFLFPSDGFRPFSL